MGLISTEHFVRKRILPIKPSRTTFVSSTNPKGHRPRGAFSSIIRTRSPPLRLCLISDHFARDWSNGKYSLIHLLQNWWAMCCTHRQWRRETSALPNIPQGKDSLFSIISRWLGVRAFSSLTSSLLLVNGRLSTIFSASHNTVCNMSSVIIGEEVKSASNTLRTTLIMRSHTPPW